MLADLYQADRTAEGLDQIGEMYGMNGRNIARYVRCDRLIPEFKVMLDMGTLSVAAGVDVSFLAEAEQRLVLDVIEHSGVKLDRAMAKVLRAAAGTLTTEYIQAIFGVDRPLEEIEKLVSVIMPIQIYIRYFADVAGRMCRGWW